MLQYSILKADDTSEGSPRMMIIIFLVTLIACPPSMYMCMNAIEAYERSYTCSRKTK